MQTWEMIKELTENPKLKFIRVSDNVTFATSSRIHEGKVIDYYVSALHSPSHGCVLLKDEWKLIPQEVTWQEAIQAWVDGKEFLIKHNGKEYKQRQCSRLGCLSDNPFSGFGNGLFTEGKWFIL